MSNGHGLSMRAYGRRRGVSDTTVRRYVDQGLIDTLTDGTIDPLVADAQLSERRTKGNHGSQTLANARKRRLVASVALLQEDVAALRDGVTDIADATAAYREMARYCAERFLSLASECAPKVAGQEPAAIAEILRADLYERMTEVTNTKLVSNKATPRKKKPGKRLAELTETELATLKADLGAERLEIKRAIKNDDLVLVDDIKAEWNKTLSISRARMLSMPKACAPVIDDDVRRAEKIIKKEIEWAVAELAWRDVTAKELLGKPRRKRATKRKPKSKLKQPK